MQKIIIAIIVIIVVLGAGYFFFNNPTDKAQAPIVTEENSLEQGNDSSSSEEANEETGEEANEQEVNKTHVIVYTDEGYFPSNVSINKGDTIIFENQSSKGMWPASAFHPTHEAYPIKSDSDCLGSSFDACKGFQSGESWSFQFNEVGEWGFHDHLTPRFFGKITVAE